MWRTDDAVDLGILFTGWTCLEALHLQDIDGQVWGSSWAHESFIVLFFISIFSLYKFVVMVTHFNYPLQVPLIYESGWNVDDILSILHIFLAMLQITYIFYYGPDYSSFYYVLHPLLFGQIKCSAQEVARIISAHDPDMSGKADR